MGKYIGATGLQYLWNKVKTLVGGKVDKVSSATNGHLAGLNASGNITDSGIVPSSLVYQGEVDDTVSPVGFDPETDTVHVTAQVLSSAQKEQARLNIGAGTSDFSGSYNDLTDTPAIPVTLDSLSDDSTHRLVTDAEKTTWNNKGTYSKPSGGIPASDLASGVIPTVPTNVSSFTNDAGYLTQHQDISGKSDKVVAVNAPTLPSSLDPNKVYQFGTLTGSVTIPAFASVSASDTEVKIWCFTFSTSTTAPTITWPAAITGWNGGEPPTINASKRYEVSVMDGIGVIIEA